MNIITGPWNAAGNGLAKRRKVLAKHEDDYATWIEVEQPSGRRYRVWGHYHRDLRKALDEFDERVVS